MRKEKREKIYRNPGAEMQAEPPNPPPEYMQERIVSSAKTQKPREKEQKRAEVQCRRRRET